MQWKHKVETTVNQFGFNIFEVESANQRCASIKATTQQTLNKYSLNYNNRWHQLHCQNMNKIEKKK